MSERWSFATGTNAKFIEATYEQFKKDPNSVDESWRMFFAGYEFAAQTQLSRDDGSQPGLTQDSANIEAFINTFRTLGHLSAHLNPMENAPELSADLKLESNHLENVSATEKFTPPNFGQGEMSFSEIKEQLTQTYCQRIGADFREINDVEIVTWLQKQMESCLNTPPVSEELKKRILEKLSEAEGFEQFLQTRYLGQKRFSLEGLDSLIPLLDILIDEAAHNSVEEICFGMAHRGRLNVLANILQKPYTRMLIEFEGSEFNPFDIDGDVKYHMGYASQVETFSKKDMRLFLAPNPSHLEAVNPLVEGFTYYRQEKYGGEDKIVPVLLHGDAAFVGQGLVAETLNLAYVSDYKTGGTIHIITNNQIGFTTNPQDSRSCTYSSDISKVIRAPVLHVNADDPEAVVWVAKLALQYRMKFKKDIVIDLIGYRRYGHNETDEPGFTQPLLYKKIAQHQTALALYRKKLQDEGFSAEEVKAPAQMVKQKLQDAYEQIKNKNLNAAIAVIPDTFAEVFLYKRATRSELLAAVKTEVSADKIMELSQKILHLPDDFTPHPKIKKLFLNRKKMVEETQSIDWGFAELLAFASLADEGFNVRLSGQDCKRGTFSSRHGVVFDNQTGEPYEPLNHLNKGKVNIINSPLSEQGCLGFEFGYSIGTRKTLVLWEAQFGDFANGGQIIIDQFLVASEAKWQVTSALVLLLPHGYEGMGPEHSSARPERFLQCCGNSNIQVCNVTTPAQYFHLLRRQMHRRTKKPLVVFTPKSLLRHPHVISTISEFTQAHFEEIIDDQSVVSKETVEKIILCTGKIYYELLATRESRGDIDNVAIIRCEQLYPFPYVKYEKLFAQYSHVKQIVWVQEEPKNMGCWSFIAQRIEKIKQDHVELTYIGRKNSGTTAEGSRKSHLIEQQRIVEEAFSLVCGWEPQIVGKT